MADAPPRLGATQQGLEACFGGCGPNQKLCATTGPNGVSNRFLGCVDIDDPTYGCDPVACVADCPLQVPHTLGKSVCAGGVCKLGGLTPTCRAGWDNCDGDWKNGCETNLTLAASCGACGNACGPGQVCEGGACVAACTPPNEDCGNGACQNLATSPLACGCNTCSDVNGSPVCAGGACTAPTCDPGFGPCTNGGCCDYANDPYSCGGANKQCAAPTGYGGARTSRCSGGKCTANCAAGYVGCGTVCADPAADRSHCGACGVTCGATETCVGGGCIARDSLVVADGFGNVQGVTSNATRIFVYDGTAPGRLWAIDKATSAKTLVASGFVALTPRRWDADAGYVYFGGGTAIHRVPAGGGAIEALYPVANQPIAFAVDPAPGGNVYWSVLSSGTYAAAKAGGGAPAIVQDGFNAHAQTHYARTPGVLRVGGGKLYGLNGGSGNPKLDDILWEMDIATSVVKTRGFLGTGLYPSAELATDGVETWYTVDRMGFGLWKTGTSPDPVLLPGPATNLVAGDSCGIVYFLTGGDLWKVASRPSKLGEWGTAARAIARNVAATGFVLDETHVWYTTATTLSRVAREPVNVSPPDAGAGDAATDVASDATTDAAGDAAEGGSGSSASSSSGGSTSSSGGGGSSGASGGASSGGTTSTSSSGGASGGGSSSGGGCAAATRPAGRAWFAGAVVVVAGLLARRRRRSR